MNPDQVPKNNKLEVKKDEYRDLINDFGIFITLNATRLDQQIIEDKEDELSNLMADLRKPIINGLNYSEFTSKHHAELDKPEVSKALITQIYKFLLYIEPRLNMFKPESDWVKRFEIIKEKYVNLVSKES